VATRAVLLGPFTFEDVTASIVVDGPCRSRLRSEPAARWDSAPFDFR
jgi:hypothetical protein